MPGFPGAPSPSSARGLAVHGTRAITPGGVATVDACHSADGPSWGSAPPDGPSWGSALPGRTRQNHSPILKGIGLQSARPQALLGCHQKAPILPTNHPIRSPVRHFLRVSQYACRHAAKEELGESTLAPNLGIPGRFLEESSLNPKSKVVRKPGSPPLATAAMRFRYPSRAG